MGRPSPRFVIILLVVASAFAAVAFLRPWLTGIDSSNRSKSSSAPNGSSTATPTGTVGDLATKEQPKPPLDIPRVISLPGSWQRQNLFIKPGHWTSLWAEGESTVADYRGTLTSELLGMEGEQVRLSPQRRRLDISRPVTFPTGDPRVAEQWLFTPNLYDRIFVGDPYGQGPDMQHHLRERASIESTLRAAGLQLALGPNAESSADLQTRKPTFALRHHQSLFVVLAAKPATYRNFGRLPLILAFPADDSLPVDQYAHYRFVNADDPRRAPLASHFAGWTTTALLVWDGYDPELLTDEQRRALVDWLHWGGRMVVVGPESLDVLGRSFLAPYLPARSTGIKPLDADALAPLNEWTIDRTAPERTRPWPGVQLVPAEGSRTSLGGDAGSTPLVVEREVGRGRVVVTAFRLTQPELTEWPSYDGFVNGCLLGRLPRIWLDDFANNQRVQRPAWRSKPNASWYDPRDISDVRYAVRDAFQGANANPNIWLGPGNAAWRDDGAAVDAARRMLLDEAGIVIPSVGIVVAIVGIYLLVLVPLNALVFYWLGRVEWAWFAAPVISLVFAIAVVRIAQLDIGFARSMNEVAVVELQPQYPRAHVSRFGAVYNSLGTDYTLESQDPTTIMLPFAAAMRPNVGPEGTLRLRRPDPAEGTTGKTELEDFLVESNSTSMYRAEQMLDVGGMIKFELLAPDRARLTNGTTIALNDLRLVGSFTGRADSLAPHASIEIERAKDSSDRDPEVAGPTQEARAQLENAVQMVDRDSLRLIAWSNTTVAGLTLEPEPSQQRRATLVVAHLEYVPFDHVRDANLPRPRRHDDPEEP